MLYAGEDMDMFTCRTSGRCIPQSWMCDRDIDCEDFSDEAECSKKPYRLSTHLYSTSHNVTRTLSLTECNDDEVMCPSGVCIHEDWVCDFYNDCGDRWDEQDCFSATDSPPVFPTEDPESYNSTGYCECMCTSGMTSRSSEVT